MIKRDIFNFYVLSFEYSLEEIGISQTPVLMLI